MSKLCKRYLVSGRVQGVFFRDGTRKKAIELDITGWVRNLSDGRVELIACGTVESIRKLEIWLRKGTPASEVQEVVTEEVAFEHHERFVVMPTGF
jgi:acylphosphatase